MDQQLGRVLKAVKKLNLDKNTVIVLWGDHGWHLGDHGMWTKHTNYEQATRIPLIIKAPRSGAKKRESNQIVETVDLFPTLVDLANIDTSDVELKLDGKSLEPILNDPSAKVKDHIYHAFIRGGYLGEAIRNRRYRMVRWTNLKDKEKIAFELYDYDQDPEEKVNIARTQDKILQDLIKILDDYPDAKKPANRPR